MSLKNKVVLVTGAGRGIGREIFVDLAVEGAVVIGVDYNSEYAQDLTAFLKKEDLLGEGMVMDVTKPESIEECFAAIKERHGAPEILINNAGITRDNLMMRMSQEEWDQVIATNLTAIFRLSKTCLRDMVKARFGRIVNISSVIGYMGNSGQANYAASKAGVIGFSKSLAQEVASRGVTVNSIAPGFIESDMTDKLSSEQKERILERIPMKKIGKVSDVLEAVKFLLSEKAGYITGSTIHVNGGMYMI